jgi:hypothetical protein
MLRVRVRCNAKGQGGLLQLQAMLANITNSFRDMTNA